MFVIMARDIPRGADDIVVRRQAVGGRGIDAFTLRCRIIKCRQQGGCPEAVAYGVRTRGAPLPRSDQRPLSGG